MTDRTGASRQARYRAKAGKVISTPIDEKAARDLALIQHHYGATVRQAIEGALERMAQQIKEKSPR